MNKSLNKGKIFNDPVYGFVTVPYGIIFDLIEHPYFQRLRRIKQVSMTHFVYPGALHTRFHHALGALHLMQEVIEVLRQKGIAISDEEAEAVSIAILLHDIGHGPFSHTLEHTLINVNHEALSTLIMEKLNEEFSGRLDLAIAIFNDEYPRKFLHQLVSSQLDMDRLDYLNRDSFFTGVYEGVVGYDRIIKMLSVYNDELVVEQKGIYSVEKFLIARRLMYWQVYLHKTVLAAEQMLVLTLSRAKQLVKNNHAIDIPHNLNFFFFNNLDHHNMLAHRDELLHHFSRLDDHDIVFALKMWSYNDDPLLKYLANSLLNRKLFRLELRNAPFKDQYVENIIQKTEQWSKFPPEVSRQLIIEGKETNSAYSTSHEEIKILFKDGSVLPMSQSSDYNIQARIITKYFLCYPKYLD